MDTQVLAKQGMIIGQLQILFPSSKTMETTIFVFSVGESLNSDDVVESVNVLSTIEKEIEARGKVEGKDIDGLIASAETTSTKVGDLTTLKTTAKTSAVQLQMNFTTKLGFYGKQ